VRVEAGFSVKSVGAIIDVIVFCYHFIKRTTAYYWHGFDTEVATQPMGKTQSSFGLSIQVVLFARPTITRKWLVTLPVVTWL